METQFLKMTRKQFNALKAGTIIKSSCGWNPEKPIIPPIEITEENKETLWKIIKFNNLQGRMFFVEE